MIAQTVDASLQNAVEHATAALVFAGTTAAVAKFAGGLGLAATILLLRGDAARPGAGARRGPSKNDNGPKTELALVSTSDGVPLPPGAVHRFGSRQFRHPDGINGSAMSPDGKYLATLGQRSVIVWDLQTFAAKQIIRDQRILSQGMDVGGLSARLPARWPLSRGDRRPLSRDGIGPSS